MNSEKDDTAPDAAENRAVAEEREELSANQSNAATDREEGSSCDFDSDGSPDYSDLQIGSRGSLLWKIIGNDLSSPSYILGTHHLASENFARQIPKLAEIMNEVEQVAGEIIVTDMASVREEMDENIFLPEHYRYCEMLDERQYQVLDAGLREVLGQGLDYYQGHHPAILAMMYASAISRRAIPFYLRGGVGIDQYIQDVARASGKQVIGLESTQDQIDMALNSEDIPTMASMLAEVVEDTRQNRESAAALFAAYVSGDLEKVYAEAISTKGGFTLSPKYRNALNVERNEKWLRLLPDIMRVGPSLIAVGALHLCAEEGLLRGIERMGYDVSPVK